MSKHLPIHIRLATPSDIPFLSDAWIRNYRKGNICKGVEGDLYWRRMHQILKVILPRATVLIACHPEDMGVIFGFACAEYVDNDLVLHYVYVKRDFKVRELPGGDYKGFGIGSHLFNQFLEQEAPRRVVCTHMTPQGRYFTEALSEKTGLEFEYDPYLLFSTLPAGWAR